MIHSLASITITYVVLKIFKGGLTSLLIVFTYTMLHLTVGYWATATSTYDIKWTMPQCVLTLRLIGLAFNVYDGSQPQVGLTKTFFFFFRYTEKKIFFNLTFYLTFRKVCQKRIERLHYRQFQAFWKYLLIHIFLPVF